MTHIPHESQPIDCTSVHDFSKFYTWRRVTRGWRVASINDNPISDANVQSSTSECSFNLSSAGTECMAHITFYWLHIAVLHGRFKYTEIRPSCRRRLVTLSTPTTRQRMTHASGLLFVDAMRLLLTWDRQTPAVRCCGVLQIFVLMSRFYCSESELPIRQDRNTLRCSYPRHTRYPITPTAFPIIL